MKLGHGDAASAPGVAPVRSSAVGASAGVRWWLDSEGVLTLSIDRPEVKNAIDTPAQFDLVDKLNDASRHPGVKVVVITGTGDSFCTGADVRSMGAADPGDWIAAEFAETPAWQTLEARTERLQRVAEASLRLHRMGKPTIAKLRGAAAGSGFSMALACDFRLASTDAFLVSGFARIGTPGDYGASYFLTHLVGPSRAKEILMFSERITAADALSLGLLNRVVPSDDLDALVDDWALRLARGPVLAYGAIKQNVHAAMQAPIERVLELEAVNMIRCRMSDDGREAVAAFQQKRKPTFSGR